MSKWSLPFRKGYIALDSYLKMKPIRVYEYRCPHCGSVNTRYCETARIVCSSCEQSFYG